VTTIPVRISSWPGRLGLSSMFGVLFGAALGRDLRRLRGASRSPSVPARAAKPARGADTHPRPWSASPRLSTIAMIILPDLRNVDRPSTTGRAGIFIGGTIPRTRRAGGRRRNTRFSNMKPATFATYVKLFALSPCCCRAVVRNLVSLCGKRQKAGGVARGDAAGCFWSASPSSSCSIPWVLLPESRHRPSPTTFSRWWPGLRRFAALGMKTSFQGGCSRSAGGPIGLHDRGGRLWIRGPGVVLQSK